MSAKMPASSDRNLCWTLKHGFVYCFAYGLHEQSYPQLMFASRHLGIVNVSLSIMYINKYKTYGIFIETLSSILLGLSPVIIIACPAELHTQYKTAVLAMATYLLYTYHLIQGCLSRCCNQTLTVDWLMTIYHQGFRISRA